ncbi:MAG: cobaltochelatase subunit CobN, partial [Microvirga sp.]
MHLLPVTAISLDEGGEATDLQQPPGDIVVLSFADSDLGALAAAHRLAAGGPSLRLASLRRLRHPLSVDLYIDKTVVKARFVLVRCLGGLDYWRYGIEHLAQACRSHGVKLAVLPGDDRPDPRLSAYATVPQALCDELESYFQAGGIDNMSRLLVRIGVEIGEVEAVVELPRAAPRAFAWVHQTLLFKQTPHPEEQPSGCISKEDPESTGSSFEMPAAQAPQDEVYSGETGRIVEPEALLSHLSTERPLACLLVYRSTVLSGDTQAFKALAAALAERSIDSLVLAISSLKDPEAVAVVGRAIRARRPDIIVTTTAFSSRDDGSFVHDEADCPILQAIPVGSAKEAWETSPRGLSAADLAMQIALPEFDGRIAAGPV